MNINFDINLLSWQKDALDMCQNNQHDICVIKSPRQRGKSFFVEFYVIKFALEHKYSRTYYLSVSFRQCSKVFEELKQVLNGAPFVSRIDNVQLIIKFTNGSTIYFISAEQDEERLQGNTCELLVIDEASYISDDIIYAVMPYTNSTKGQIICVSTPRFKQGAFYSLYADGIDETISDVHTLDVNDYDTSSMISESRLAYYRKSLSKLKYQMYYLGLFCDSSGEVFEDFNKCIGVPTEEDYKEECCAGIDWATNSGQDSTVVTVITKSNVVLGILAFNDLGVQESIEQITKFLSQFNIKKVLVEKNSIGAIYFDLLKKHTKSAGHNWNIEAFVTTNESKLAMVELLQVLFQNKEIVIPNNEELSKQLSTYAMTVSKSGKQIFNAISGSHDDYVISLMLAAWSVKKNKPKVSF